MAKYVGAIDQGTTSTPLHPVRPRRAGSRRSTSASTSRSPRRPAGSSTTPREIWQRTREVIDGALGAVPTPRRATSRRSASPTSARRRSCGIARAASRSTTRSCGRTRAPTSSCASSPASEGAGPPARARRAAAVDVLLGAEDRAGCSTTSRARASAPRRASSLSARSTRWLLWNLTGGADGGVHATDVTNASRTLLMDLETLDWHEPSLELMGIPRSMLPEIRSSSEVYGEAAGTAVGGRADRGHPRRPAGGAVRADLLRARRGEEHLRDRLVPAGQHRRGDRALGAAADDVAYRLGDGEPAYALEGSIAVTGALVQWLRDRLGLIESAAEVEELARTRRRTTAACTSCPPSPGCSRRTGATTRAA